MGIICGWRFYNMIKTYRVEGMTCMHCVHHVKEALSECEGVKVSLELKTAIINSEVELSFDTLKAAIDEVGYEIFEK